MWEREEGKQRTEYVTRAQQRATELHPGAIVRPWLPFDGIQPDLVSEAATRELRDACEQYARERVQIIGTPFASGGAVDSDQVVAHWIKRVSPGVECSNASRRSRQPADAHGLRRAALAAGGRAGVASVVAG